MILYIRHDAIRDDATRHNASQGNRIKEGSIHIIEHLYLSYPFLLLLPDPFFSTCKPLPKGSHIPEGKGRVGGSGPPHSPNDPVEPLHARTKCHPYVRRGPGESRSWPWQDLWVSHGYPPCASFLDSARLNRGDGR